jgi:hypothetical protein
MSGSFEAEPFRGHLITPPHATQHPSGSSGLFYWDKDTAASKMHACKMHACKMHACERYVPVRDVCP